MFVARSLDDDCEVQVGETKTSLWREAGAGVEWLELRHSRVYRGNGVPHGDGQPVVAVPGFLASDAHLIELRLWLKRIGYAAQASDIGFNADCPDVMIERLTETVESVAATSGMRVRIIGHSLGGVIARATAVRRPDLVSQVITLASPLRQLNAHPLVASAARVLDSVVASPLERPRRHGDHAHATTCFCEMATALEGPFPRGVMSASIYSQHDGIVDWRSCLDPAGANVAVASSHLGIIVNRHAYREIAHLLARDLASLDRAA